MAPVKATLKEEKSSDKRLDNYYANDDAYKATTDPATDEAQEATDSATSTNTRPRQITMLRMSAPTSARARAILSSQPSKPNPRKRLAAIVAHPFQNTEEPTNGAGSDDTQEASDDVAVNETQDNINPSTSTNLGIRQITMLRMSAPTSARAQAILSSQPSKPNPPKRLAAVVSHSFQPSGSAKTARGPTLKRKKSSGDEDDKKEEATDEDSEPSSSSDGSARKKKKVNWQT